MSHNQKILLVLLLILFGLALLTSVWCKMKFNAVQARPMPSQESLRLERLGKVEQRFSALAAYFENADYCWMNDPNEGMIRLYKANRRVGAEHIEYVADRTTLVAHIMELVPVDTVPGWDEEKQDV